MITEHVPADWRGLQHSVGEILRESGFTVEIEKTVKTARGSVEIDVYAEEVVKGRKYTVLVECKNWSARVPQTVIHSFRTVVADMGANVGYLVSTAGFQSGALTAAELTNLRLLNWQEFQDEFERTWYEAHVLPTVAERMDALLTYTEPLLPLWFYDLPENSRGEYLELKRRYDEFGWTMMMFAPYSHLLHGGRDPRVALPLRARLEGHATPHQEWPQAVLDARGYREFLHAALLFSDEIVEKFRGYRPAAVTTDESSLPPHA